MTCDELRTLTTEGAPLDEAARGHLAECAACGEEFAELRALTTAGSAAPDALRERVLAAFPVRRPTRWTSVGRAAAMLLIGILGGFAGGYFAKPARETVVVKPEIKEVEKPVAVEAPPSDDTVFNISVAAHTVYGEKVDIKYEGMHVQKIVIDGFVKNCEQMCPVARQLRWLSEKRPDIVTYRSPEKREAKEKKDY